MPHRPRGAHPRLPAEGSLRHPRRGPHLAGGGQGEPGLLRRTYHAAFDAARGQPTVRSIAFPAISTGVYAFPREQAARIALEAMRARAPELDRVVAAVFSDADRELYLVTLAALG